MKLVIQFTGHRSTDNELIDGGGAAKSNSLVIAAPAKNVLFRGVSTTIWFGNSRAAAHRQITDWLNDLKPKMIIIDDLMSESFSGGAIVNLFTKGSHHNNLSVIFITPNIFHQGKG